MCATVDAEGNIEYWVCSGCGKKFKDADGTEEVTDVSIPKLTPQLVTPVKPSTPAKLPFNPNAGSDTKKFPFADVPRENWYYSSVKAAWENGLIDGVTANEFKPNATLTVAQTIKLAAAVSQSNLAVAAMNKKTRNHTVRHGSSPFLFLSLSFGFPPGGGAAARDGCDRSEIPLLRRISARLH